MIAAHPDHTPNAAAARRQRSSPSEQCGKRGLGRGCPGFTTVELAIALTVVAVLAAVAIPSYADHLRRARIAEALTQLADQRVRLEQHFLDNRRYDDGNGGCAALATPAVTADNFAIECRADAATFTLAAVGIPGRGMQGFVFTIDEANHRRTPSVPTGWMNSERCWVIRHDGTCGG